MKHFHVLLLLLVVSNSLAQTPQLIVPIGHSGIVTSVAISPDGQYLLTGSADKTAKLWDYAGHEIQTFRGHAFVVSSVAFSPDGTQLLTGSYDGTVKRWSLSGKLQQTYSGHNNYVNAVAFSPDGKSILSGSKDNAAILWDLAGGKMATLSQADQVNAAAFSPDGKSVLLGLENGTARLINLSTQKAVNFKHGGSVNSVAFSPEGGSILTVSPSGSAKRWDISGSLRQTYEQQGGIQVAAFAAAGASVLTGSYESGEAILWDLEGKKLLSYKGHEWGIEAAAVSPDGAYILTGSADRTAKLWNPSGRTLRTLKGHSTNISALACSPDGRLLLTGSMDGALKLADLSGFEFRALEGHKDRVSALAFSPDGKFILTGSYDKTATLRDASGKVLHTLEGHKNTITSLAFSPYGQLLLTGSLDKTIRLWDMTGQLKQTFTESSEVKSLAFLPDGQSFMAGYEDQTIKIRDMSGKLIHSFNLPSQLKAAVAGPNGTILAGYYNGLAQLWDNSGLPLETFGSPGNEPVSALAFSADGETILIGDAAGNVKGWNIATKTFKIFTGHRSEITAVAFLSEGSVLTGSMDCTAKFWDATFAQERATLIAVDSSDWAVTTPIGLFDASSGAMRLMYYVDQQSVIEFEQLKERYYEPGILPMMLGFAKDNIRQVSSFTGVALYPKVDARVDTTRQELKIDLTPQNGGLGKLSLFIGTKEIEEDINSKRLSSLSVDLRKYTSFFSRGKEDTLVLRAFNEAGWVRSPAIELPYQAQFAGAKGTGSGGEEVQSLGSNTPHLYGIFIGTSDYKNQDLKLKFPDLDAAAMAQAVEGAGKLLFKDRVHIRVLSTAGKTAADISTKTNIEAAFKDFAGKAETGDVLVVYFSGHGVNYGVAETGQFYYLTKDVPSESLVDSFIRRNYTVSSTELTDWIKAIPARKQVMILDACNSGKIVEAVKKDLNTSRVRAIDRMKDRTGMYILTGSAADKVSYEDSRYGQGLLTYSLLQGMSGMALTPDKRVDVMTLFQYSRDQVPQLAKGIGGIQTPVMAFPLGGESIDIGIMNDQVTITMAQAKPVVVQAEFQEEQQFKDILRLSDALDSYFEELTLQEAQSDIVFRKVKDYDNAYSIKGRYTITGDAVEVRGLLFKGDTPQGQVFKVKGVKSKLPALVEQVIDAVGEYIK